MRSRIFLAMAMVAALVSGAAASTPAAEPTATGLWEESDSSGRVGAWFYIFELNGTYVGAMVKMFVKPGGNPNPLCTACSGSEKNQPSLGLLMIKGMQRNGRSYENGTILDPRDGNVYNATMEVTADGQKLKLRGYVGIPLFGQTQVWKRLPDDALPAAEVPPNLVQYWPVQPVQPVKQTKSLRPPQKP